MWMQEGVFGFFMNNYVERSSLGTIMGPLYMIPHVWCDKDGAMLLVEVLGKFSVILVVQAHPKVVFGS